MKARLTHTANLILASTSEGRRKLLTDAGLTFSQQSPGVDEDMLKPTLANMSPKDMAMELARAKGKDVAIENPDAVVIAGDQICLLGDDILEKPLKNDRAAEQLRRLSGRSHYLLTSGVVMQGERTLWHGFTTTALHMRQLRDREIDKYILKEDVRFCCGSYKIEGLGLNLFERIDGDWLAIMGLPLLPILNTLNTHKIVKLY